MEKPIKLLFILTVTVVSSVIITENYVEEFKSGIEEFERSAEEYYNEEEDFDFYLHNETNAELDSTEYDFIVLGAGAAGSVIANRLSENPEWKVLLVEAGGPETPYTKIPRFDYLLSETKFNWGFKTIPQTTWCLGMINNQCAIAAGKALGGSTAINGMLYTRGNPNDYNTWAKLGNDGWSYNDVLPYFKKAEDADVALFDKTYRSLNGPFHLENPRYTTPIANHTLAAAQELGLDIIDYNGKQQLGFGFAQLSTKRGHRQSTAEAYLKPASIRPNLVIKAFSHVVKVLINPESKEATGVLYLQKGKLHAAKATKEVIVSGGTFGTPKILILSGIGPADHLKELEIPLIQDLKVGYNLKNHLGFFGLDFIYNNPEAVSEEDDENKFGESDEVVNYLKNGRGSLSTNGFETVGYFQSKPSKYATKLPDMEMFFMNNIISSSSKFNPLRYKANIFSSLWKSADSKKSINVGLLLAHPKSVGRLTLKDKDPLHEPLIDLNQLSDPGDVDINSLVNGIRYAIKFMNTNAMKKLNLVLNDSPVAGCEEHKWGCDDYWRCAIRHISTSYRHQTGTARMGPKSDSNAVVCNELRVHGVKKLRVADASVIPVTTTGHTMAPTIMIGEKASDLIKASWR